VARYDTALVLLFDPADCFTCDGALADFVDPGLKLPVVLVLTRPPDEGERHLLAMYRIHWDGTLEQDGGLPIHTSAVYLWHDRQFHPVGLPTAQEWVRTRSRR
jgi:hypothetical protein